MGQSAYWVLTYLNKRFENFFHHWEKHRLRTKISACSLSRSCFIVHLLFIHHSAHFLKLVKIMFTLSLLFFHSFYPLNTKTAFKMVLFFILLTFLFAVKPHICRETMHLKDSFQLPPGVKMSNGFFNKPSSQTSRDDSESRLSCRYCSCKTTLGLKNIVWTDREQRLIQLFSRRRERESWNKFNVPIKRGGCSEWNWPQVSSEHISSKFNLKFTFGFLRLLFRAQNLSRQHMKYLRELN